MNKQQTNYLNNRGTQCPHCNSDTLNIIGTEHGNEKIWRDVYELTRFIDLRTPGDPT